MDRQRLLDGTLFAALLCLSHLHGIVSVGDLVLNDVLRRSRVLERHKLHKLVLHVLFEGRRILQAASDVGTCRPKGYILWSFRIEIHFSLSTAQNWIGNKEIISRVHKPYLNEVQASIDVMLHDEYNEMRMWLFDAVVQHPNENVGVVLELHHQFLFLLHDLL